jgi:hypothetical protein
LAGHIHFYYFLGFRIPFFNTWKSDEIEMKC